MMKARVLRTIAGIVAGLFAWIVVASVGNRVLRAAWPSYATVEVAMNFTLAMLLSRLLLGALSSLCAGFFAAGIAKGNRVAIMVLAGLLLVAFIPVHYTLWERFPVWYHLTFLVSLVAVTVLGAMIYSRYVGPRREQHGQGKRYGPK
jgi:hypothetical protein